MKGSSNPFGNFPYAEVVVGKPSEHFAQRVQTISRHAMLSRLCESIVFRSFGRFRDLFSDWMKFQKTVAVSVNGKFLRKVEVVGKRKSQIQVSFSLEIDWDRHEVLSKDSRGGNTFVFRSDRPIEDQVDKAIIRLIGFLRKRIEKGEIDSLAPLYHWISGSEAQRDEWSRVAGTGSFTPEDLAEYRAFNRKAYGLEFSPAKLKELTIAVKSG